MLEFQSGNRGNEATLRHDAPIGKLYRSLQNLRPLFAAARARTLCYAKPCRVKFIAAEQGTAFDPFVIQTCGLIRPLSPQEEEQEEIPTLEKLSLLLC